MSKTIIDTINHRLSSRGQKLDANQTAFIQQELTQILSKILEVKYPALLGRTLVPLNTSMSAGAEYFKTKVYDGIGMADIITSATTDLNMLNIVAEEIIQRIQEVGAVYSWTIAELEAAAFSNTPLSMLEAKNARLAIETAIDSIIATGGTRQTPSSVTKQTGLLNNVNVPTFVFPYNPATATSEQMLQNLNDWANNVTVQTNTTFSANRMILSPYWFNRLSTQPYSAMVPDSILKVFLDNSPSITSIDQWTYCSDPTVATDGYDLGVVYQATDDVLTFGNPVPYEEQPPQFINLKVQIPVRATVAPTVIYQPLAMSYAIFQREL